MKWFIFFTKNNRRNYFDLDAITKTIIHCKYSKNISTKCYESKKVVRKQHELRGNPTSGNASRCNKDGSIISY